LKESLACDMIKKGLATRSINLHSCESIHKKKKL